MISGKALLRTALLPLLLIATTASSAAPDADTLLKQLARPAPAKTRFVEVRFSHLLDKAIVASGELEYLGPDSLSRTVETPFRERTEIKGSSVSVAREGQKAQRFSLRRAPELRSLLTSFSALLGGDRAALEKDFVLSVAGESAEGAWTLTLTPRDKRVATHLRDIVINGVGGEPRCLVTTEPDDDSSVMLLAAAASSAQLPESPDRAWFTQYCASLPRN